MDDDDILLLDTMMMAGNYIRQDLVSRTVTIDLDDTWEPMRGLLKRKRNRQYAAITMSALADRYRTDVYVHLTPLVESFL